jgi:hypothetical protein
MRELTFYLFTQQGWAYGALQMGKVSDEWAGASGNAFYRQEYNFAASNQVPVAKEFKPASLSVLFLVSY